MRLMKRVQSKNKRYFIYEAIFIILAFLVRNKGILADEGILEKINIAKQCFDVALSIVLSLFAGMLLVYKNRISIVISMIRFVNKILFLLIVLEILVSDDISGMKMWGMGFLLLVSMLAASVSLRKNKKYKDKTEPGEKLYHSREEQRNQLVKKIREDDDMETICVSAPWGSGKTFFIEKVCDELDEYPILTINAMDMEDQQKLYQYVLNCISELLDERGYYTGFNSEWHKYVSAFSKVLFGKNDLLNQIFSAGASDYRNQKIVLNEIFEKAFKEQKLVIIVDDLERCIVEKAKQYLQFIKEISTFPRTMVIFLADYQKLISNEIITQEAANKFITEIMVLREASCDEIQQELKNKYDFNMDRKTIAQMKESLHRKQLVHELMNLCDNRVMINHQPPCTLFSDVYGVLKEMDGSDIMGAQGWKNQLLTAQVYYYNMSGWKTMRTYRDAWMENSSDIDARLEWDTEDKIQHAIDCLKNELCEAEQILIANEAIAYPDVHKIILNCEIGIKQMQALLEIRKLLENNDSKQMMGEKEVLNILDEILNSFCTEKNRVRWDFDEIKVCINAVEKMDNPSIALQSVEKLHEIVTYISRLNPEWKYIALLRSRLFALQKKLQKEVK